jgi:hypothetical protein
MLFTVKIALHLETWKRGWMLAAKEALDRSLAQLCSLLPIDLKL